MFRVYGPDGKPLHTSDYLAFSDSGATPGMPVFVIGNPGSTSRRNTVAQLEYRRDFQYPFTIRLLESRADLRRFIQFPYQLYRDDSMWVPPLRSEQWAQFDPQRNPMLDHCEYSLYLLNDGVIVAGGPTRELVESKDPFVHQFLHAEPDGPVRFHFPAHPFAEDLQLLPPAAGAAPAS